MKHRLRNTRWILWILAILIAPSACSSCILHPNYTQSSPLPSVTKAPSVTKDFTNTIPEWPNEHCPTTSSFSTIGIHAVSVTGGESFTIGITNGVPNSNCAPTVYLNIHKTLSTIPTTPLTDTRSGGSLSITSLAKTDTTGQADYPGEPHIYYTAQATWDPPTPAGLYIGETADGNYQAIWVFLPATGNEPQVQRAAIRNESTGELLVAPSITVTDIALRQVTVPNLGITFTLKIIPLQAQKTIPPK